MMEPILRVCVCVREWECQWERVCERESVSECECAGILEGWSPHHQFQSTQALPEHGASEGGLSRMLGRISETNSVY